MWGDKKRTRRHSRDIVDVLLLIFVVVGVAGALVRPPAARAAVITAPPASPVKLIFIHHSVGSEWLSDYVGGLGIALRDSNYFVSEANYGWGPDAIGDRTDLGHWWTWFRGPSSPTYLTALYAESGKTNDYSRLATDPGGPNEIVMFKSCYPNSQLSDPDSPIPPIADNPMRDRYFDHDSYTVANAKGIYLDLLDYFGAHPEKLFVAVVAPPVTTPDTPGGRALANWLVDHWLQDSGYTVGNVMVFDLYNVLTSKTGGGESDVGLETGNHHRVWDGAVQHKTDDGADRLAYPGPDGDSHPTAPGLQKATAEFVPLLNAAYNAWRGSGGLSLGAAALIVPYKGTTTLTVHLVDETGAPLAGYPVDVQKSIDRVTWTTFATVESDGGTAVTPALTQATWFRATWAGAGEYDPGTSYYVQVKPKVALQNPVAPTSVKEYVTFLVSGTFKPRHSPGWNKAVRLYCYRKDPTTGKWILKKAPWCKTVDYLSYSKYRVKIYLGSRGVWKLRAFAPEDARHAATWSTSHYLTVK